MKVAHPFLGDAVRTGVLMSTDIEIVCGDRPDLAEPAYELMSNLVDILNFYSPDSALSQLNSGPKQTCVEVPELLWEVLALSKLFENQTQGWFRIDFEGVSRCPSGEHFADVMFPNLVKLGADTCINLGGIGKGFIVDKVAAYLESQGSLVYLVNAGGDLRARSSSHPWKIGIVNPLDESKFIGHIALKNGAVVSSGTYARSHQIAGKRRSHFFNPFLGEFMANPPFLSVTVEGRSAMMAEVWGKCVLMGNSGPYPKELKFLVVDSISHRARVINSFSRMPIA